MATDFFARACGILVCSMILTACNHPEAITAKIAVTHEGRPMECTIIGNGPETLLIIATIHGREYAGTPLVHRLERALRIHPHATNGRRVLLVPVANPDGHAIRARGNARQVDLNRNFPAGNRRNVSRHGTEPLSEPESRALHDLIDREKPSHILSIHQPLACIDFDGPAEDLARFMAQYCPLPITKLGSRPGSLGSFAGVERNVPTITLELREGDERLPYSELWNLYGPALVGFVTYPVAPPSSVFRRYWQMPLFGACLVALGLTGILLRRRARRNWQTGRHS